MGGITLPERIAQIYYSYGLFCSSHPTIAITLSLSLVLICCYPLLNVPLPGNIPIVVNIPTSKRSQPQADGISNSSDYQNKDKLLELQHLLNETGKLPYVWAKESPYLYVQQIILKTGVLPWNSNLHMWDAFRAPLQEAFRILETVRNHEDPETKTTLLRHCYQIDNVRRDNSKASLEQVMPEYGCLLLSPANLWQQNLQTYLLDTNLINTIFSYQNLHRGKVSIAEMAFGIHLKDAGIKRYPCRSRPRVLQFAVTIFYEKANEKFMNSLLIKLRKTYPLHQDNQYKSEQATVIYYPGQLNYYELIRLTIAIFGIFFYIYFSVRKIEFLKSKLGLAVCAVLAIACSVAMSMGLCFYFGISLNLYGKETFPYLVMIVGLENVLVLTKSVISTDSRLDVKIRLAQGLSKEGWSITNNLLTEITILTLSFFTFVPFIQEFSIFMIVSLVSDYFIQMVFFATILGIDMKRMEYSQDKTAKLYLNDYLVSNNAHSWLFDVYKDSSYTPHTITKSKSHPKLNGLGHNSSADVVAKRKSNVCSHDNKVPKRIKLVNMWARTRFFQRALMIWMIVWISMIVYNSGIVYYFVNGADKIDIKQESSKENYDKKVSKNSEYKLYLHANNKNIMYSPLFDIDDNEKAKTDINETTKLLKHTHHLQPWAKLPPYHWSSVLSQYNKSLSGHYIMILPPQLLSCRVSPEMAVSLRNPNEKEPPALRWQALAAALDPIDVAPEFELIDGARPVHMWNKAISASDLPIYPTTPMEILLLSILCTISVIVIAYMMVVLYRCVCTRNYAEWRSSWNQSKENSMAKQSGVQLVMQAVPIVVSGHRHEVECMVTDGGKIVSTCLEGTIKVWDSQNGDLLTNIDRKGFFKLKQQMMDKLQSDSMESSNTSDSDNQVINVKRSNEFQNIPKIRKTLNKHLDSINFKELQFKDNSQLSAAECTKYDFAKSYRQFYCNNPASEEYNGYALKYNPKIDKQIENHQDNIVNRYNSHVPKNELLFSSNIDKCDKNNTFRNKHSDISVYSDSNLFGNFDISTDDESVTNLDWKSKIIKESAIWCIDYCNDFIILGCEDGRLEFWDVSSKLLCVWWSHHGDRGPHGITHVRAVGGGRCVYVATLNGHLLILKLEAYNLKAGVHVDLGFSTAHRRISHKRGGSMGSIPTNFNNYDEKKENQKLCNNGEEIHCTRIAHCHAHQQLITEMHVDGGRVLTGGQDHVLKVFSNTDLTQLFTLHGHCGPITSCFIDHATPTISGSGSQDGSLCVWDLHTGVCIFSIQAHNGAVTSLAYTASYIISMGSDQRLCIWDRFQGHMLNSAHVGLNYVSRMLPLTHTLLLMGDRSGLTVYDLSNGEVIRRVLLGQTDSCVQVRQILPLKDAIVCNFANQLRIIRFPLVTKLTDYKEE